MADVKKYLTSPLKNRTIGYWLGLVAAVLAIVSAIAFIAVDYSDEKTFSLTAFIIMLVGGCSFLLVAFTKFQFAPIVPCALYIAGFSLELQATLPSLSDVWNGVNFIGGNGITGLVFTILFAVSAILSIVSNFMEQTKE